MRPPATPTCPLPRVQVIDRYFLEHRAKLLDLAAFLDRVDRAADDGARETDFRLKALRRAIPILQQEQPGRVRRILELLSDPTSDPIAKAPGKGASGAHPLED